MKGSLTFLLFVFLNYIEVTAWNCVNFINQMCLINNEITQDSCNRERIFKTKMVF